MPPNALTDCCILLVDDEAANLDLLEELLAPDGYGSIVRVQDPRDAVPAFERHAPDLVLLDLHMPVSGFEVLREIRARTAPDDWLPVLVLTADASRETRTRALGEGAQDFLTKPLDAIEVRLRVRNLLATRLLHLAQRHARAAAEAEAAARERILSFVAHDLRNPLAAIAADAEMLGYLLPQEHGAQARSAARIERIAGRMQRMIGDLLDVTRAGDGPFPVQRVAVRPAEVLGEAEAMLAPLARAAGVELRFEGSADASPILADPGRVIQLLSNLVGNSLRFTPAGGSVRVEWQEEERAHVVRVADSGSGIDPGRVPHLFRGLWERPESGLGLGLTIARAIVEAHGGWIRLEETSGAGTTIAFSIPRATGGEIGAGALSAPPPGPRSDQGEEGR